MDEMMFCYQCEQAANCTACTGKAGVCGKSAETADAQDKLTGALIGFATLLLDIGRPIRPPQALLLTEGLFTTITNVNFDPQTVAQLTDKVWKAKQEAFASASPAPAPVSDYDMQKLWQEPDPDRKSLCSFVLFGLRGMAAYSYHARVLGYTDGEIDLFFCTALRAIAQERDKDKLFQLVEDTGRMAYRVMAELDKANTGAFGDPEPVEVSLTIEKGPFIVISGHDLYDAKCLLEQTEGKGINVYTHSEMLPAHGYPELKKRFPHLKGNFGTAWQNQQREFEDIPAPVLFTTNCIMPLRPSYADRVFTTSVVSYPGVAHIGEDRDFSPVIAKALELGGYPEVRIGVRQRGDQLQRAASGDLCALRWLEQGHYSRDAQPVFSWHQHLHLHCSSRRRTVYSRRGQGRTLGDARRVGGARRLPARRPFRPGERFPRHPARHDRLRRERLYYPGCEEPLVMGKYPIIR